MPVQPHQVDWYNSLIKRCKKKNLTRNEWWLIGGEMHTLHGDYGQYGYDYEPAREDFKIMWDTWKKCEPSKEEGRP